LAAKAAAARRTVSEERQIVSRYIVRSEAHTFALIAESIATRSLRASGLHPMKDFEKAACFLPAARGRHRGVKGWSIVSKIFVRVPQAITD